MGYAQSSFRDFENYLRIVIGLDEDDIQLILKLYVSHFTRHEIPPGYFLIDDIPEIVSTQGDHPGNLYFEYDENSMKMKLVLNQSSGTSLMIGTLRFDEKSFFQYIFCLDPNWD